MERTLEAIAAKPGIVLYTLVNAERRKMLEAHCAKLSIPAISILDPTLSMLGRYLGAAMISVENADLNISCQ